MVKITTHTIVKDEENWIWYSLMSVKDLATTMLVFDDCSSDKTLELIKSIKDPKIKLTTGIIKTASGIRNKMLSETKTDWFLLLDGDEIWNSTTLQRLLNFLEKCPKEVYGVVQKTRNCVGDVYHYQPESAGKYHLLGRTGNFNIRAYRKLPGLHWIWDYPQETYADSRGRPINTQDKHLAYFDDFYWHMTFLPRSSQKAVRKHRRSIKLEKGIRIADKSELPEVFFGNKPNTIPDPLRRRPLVYEVAANLLAPIKSIRKIV